MISYDNENEKNFHGVFNDEGYLVMHWGYLDAMKEFEVLMQRYEWMGTYIKTVSRREDKKFFIHDGDADEIKRMMNDIKTKQEGIYQLLL